MIWGKWAENIYVCQFLLPGHWFGQDQQIYFDLKNVMMDASVFWEAADWTACFSSRIVTKSSLSDKLHTSTLKSF